MTAVACWSAQRGLHGGRCSLKWTAKREEAAANLHVGAVGLVAVVRREAVAVEGTHTKTMPGVDKRTAEKHTQRLVGLLRAILDVAVAVDMVRRRPTEDLSLSAPVDRTGSLDSKGTTRIENAAKRLG